MAREVPCGGKEGSSGLVIYLVGFVGRSKQDICQKSNRKLCEDVAIVGDVCFRKRAQTHHSLQEQREGEGALSALQHPNHPK